MRAAQGSSQGAPESARRGRRPPWTAPGTIRTRRRRSVPPRPREPPPRTEPLYASPTIPMPCPPWVRVCLCGVCVCVCVCVCACVRARARAAGAAGKRPGTGRGWEALLPRGLRNKTRAMPALLRSALRGELVLGSFSQLAQASSSWVPFHLSRWFLVARRSQGPAHLPHPCSPKPSPVALRLQALAS